MKKEEKQIRRDKTKKIDKNLEKIYKQFNLYHKNKKLKLEYIYK